MRPSISRRLVLWLAVPLMLLALSGALVHYFNYATPGVVSSDRRLKDAANAVMAHVRVKNDVASLDAEADKPPPLPGPDAVIFAVRDAQGRLLAGDARLPPVALSGETSQLTAVTKVGQRNLRSLTIRFDTGGGLILISVADMRLADDPTARFGLISTLLWDFIELDVTLVLVWVGTQLGLRPVKRLRDEIAERSPLDLRSINESAVPREIAPVVVTLNRLFTTLRTSVQAQQQFIANTAHHLRTPITGLQAQLDLLVADSAAAPVRHRLLILQEGIRQLAHSANQLLSLARADPAANLANRSRVSLDVLAGEVAAKFFDRALQAHIDLGIEVSPAAVFADPALLDDLLSNLVDNALKYTPPGGSVTISTSTEHGRVCLAVEDTGSGIPENERQRVRQRFYRLPGSPGHGSGLGLAIVEEIARLYGATFDLATGANGRGTRASVHFA